MSEMRIWRVTIDTDSSESDENEREDHVIRNVIESICQIEANDSDSTESSSSNSSKIDNSLDTDSQTISRDNNVSCGTAEPVPSTSE